MVPRAVLMTSGLVSVNTSRQVNVAHSKTTVNAARPMLYLSKIAHSTVKRLIHKNTSFKNCNINQWVNTVRDKNVNTARQKVVVNAVKGNNFNAVKASACWVWKSKTKVINHVSKHNSASITLKKFDYVDAQGKSKHMTGDMSNLTDYEEIDGGYVAFGGNPKGGKVTGKCTIKTARTSQQNGVAERRNRTLIEVDRTMLADSKLPTTFWAENTNFKFYETIWVSCYHSQYHRSLSPKSYHKDVSKPSSDDRKTIDEDPRKDCECNDQEKEDNDNNTNNVNAASINEVNVVGGKTSIELPDDPNMPALEDYSIFDFSRDDEDECIEAMQEELLHFKLQEVWTLVDLPNGKRAIGSKWVFKNKKDERGIVIRNKARLVAQGYTQEEGIYYDEVFAHIEEDVYVCQPLGFEDPYFPDRVYKVEKALYGLHHAPRAWYEILSTYLLDNGFQRGKNDKTLFIKRHKGDILLVQVYVDDIIFGSTKKELCIAFEKLMHEKFQRSSMGELTFFLGLQVKQMKDGIFINQDKYVA
ncbi:putative ribonuclease H-like domain-containing protein [Tanacetum coccineum]